MSTAFPRTVVGGKSLPRMLIGTNWLLGYSHTTEAVDRMIKRRNDNVESVCEILEAYLEYDINALMAPIDKDSALLQGIRKTQEKTGKEIIIIDTPIVNVDNTKEGLREAKETIRQSKENGATFCLIHHSSVEQLVNKNEQTITRLPDYLALIRENGMIPGLSCHMPEIVVYSDRLGYDVETYIQLYNCLGFLMHIEVEYANKIIREAKHPVMTIKSMAAGRCSPFVGLNFSWATLREKDMVTVGCFTPDEVHEVVEISMAAFEKRAPKIAGRSSPNKTSIMKD